MNEPNQPMTKIHGTRGSAACCSIRDFLHRSDAARVLVQHVGEGAWTIASVHRYLADG
jgi:hypothetical protein